MIYCNTDKFTYCKLHRLRDSGQLSWWCQRLGDRCSIPLISSVSPISPASLLPCTTRLLHGGSVGAQGVALVLRWHMAATCSVVMVTRVEALLLKRTRLPNVKNSAEYANIVRSRQSLHRISADGYVGYSGFKVPVPFPVCWVPCPWEESRASGENSFVWPSHSYSAFTFIIAITSPFPLTQKLLSLWTSFPRKWFLRPTSCPGINFFFCVRLFY